MAIFPEGTLNRKSASLLPFKAGAFQAAVSAQLPLLPMVVSDYRTKMSDLTSPTRVTVRVMEAVDTEGLGDQDVLALAQKCRNLMEETFVAIS